jgi:hypothetical protein
MLAETNRAESLSAYRGSPNLSQNRTTPITSSIQARAASSLLQLLQQPLRILQIARVEPLRKPPVHRSQQFARLLRPTLVSPEACEAHGGAEFPGFCCC